MGLTGSRITPSPAARELPLGGAFWVAAAAVKVAPLGGMAEGQGGKGEKTYALHNL